MFFCAADRRAVKTRRRCRRRRSGKKPLCWCGELQPITGGADDRPLCHWTTALCCCNVLEPTTRTQSIKLVLFKKKKFPPKIFKICDQDKVDLPVSHGFYRRLRLRECSRLFPAVSRWWRRMLALFHQTLFVIWFVRTRVFLRPSFTDFGRSYPMTHHVKDKRQRLSWWCLSRWCGISI